MQLNDEQQQAAETLQTWLNKSSDKKDLIRTLSGFAGTGKSTVANEILRGQRDVVVSAPTHKARKVIENKTHKPSETVQALLGLRPDVELDNFNPNKPVFNLLAEEKIKYFKTIVIDEGSMVNNSARIMIEEKAQKYGTKILYIGDALQLAPVGENISTVFTKYPLTSLNTIVRQEDSNPNTKLIELSRNDVLYGTSTFLPYLNSIKQDMHNGEGFKLLPMEGFYKGILEHYFNSEYAVDYDYAKTICYSNDTVKKINKYIRNQVNRNTELVAKGDVLMGYNTVSLQIMDAPYYRPLISNSEDYIVQSSELIELPIEGTVYTGYRVKLQLVDEYLFILHPLSYKDFYDEIYRRMDEAKLFKKWPAYYRFKNQILVMDDFYYPDNKTLLVKKDIDYGYSLTVHKAQGSTYKNVGIVLKDIESCYKIADRRRLRYVALSRTSKNNLIYAK